MYITPIAELQAEDIVTANKVRRLKVKDVINNIELVNVIFRKLTSALDVANNTEVKQILSYELFYEIIPTECVSEIISVYTQLSNKDFCIGLLKNSYISKGDRGFLFSFMPIIKKFCYR